MTGTAGDVTARLRELEAQVLGRAPEHDLVPSLDRVRAVLNLLGDPQRGFRVIHVTGTNGKTSTTRIIDTLCRELGLRTGRFTSPHLHSLRERIGVDGEPVDAEVLVRTYDEVRPLLDLVDAQSAAAGAPRLTFFEVLVVLAYAVFADAPVDVAVVEVGMGGTWDATNVADGDVAVVAPVAVDHVHFLGSSIEQIAQEKAGIVKPGAIAVCALQQPEVGLVLADRAAQVGARLALEGVDFGVTERSLAVGGQQLSLHGLAGDYRDLFLPLHGLHQASNAALAVAAVEAFLGGGERRLDPQVVRAGLAAVTSPGRLEVVRRSPTILVDAAHNPHGMAALGEALAETFGFTTLVGVLAVFADKDAAGMLAELEPALHHVVVTRNSSPRSMDPRELAEVAVDIFGEDRVSLAGDLPEAIEMAVTLAELDGLGGGVVATGSVVTAADVRRLVGVSRA